MQHSSNPALSDKALRGLADSAPATETMNRGGSIAKTALATALVIAAAAFAWVNIPIENMVTYWLWFGGASVVAIGAALVITLGKRANLVTVGLYAVAEGVALGLLSSLFGAAYEGIVLQAILLTFATLIAMLLLYTTGIVKVTQKFRSVMLIMTGGVLIFLLAELLIGLFVPGLWDVTMAGPWGIAISAVIVLIAALNLLLDFDFIDRGVEAKLPKKAEWYAAFGLMATLIWLYVSILRLLAATRR